MNTGIKRTLKRYTPSFVKIPYRFIKKSIHEFIFSIEQAIYGTIITHMGVLVTNVCNLNCRDCADLVNYRQINSYNVDDAINDLAKILQSVYKIKEVLLIGGETLLYKDLNKLLSWCLNQEKIDKVIITTNGTIMPSEKIMDIMSSSPKSVFRVSGYKKDVAPHRQEIVDAILQRGIRCENLDGMQWKDIGDNIKRNRSLSQLKKTFRTCGMKYCVSLEAGGNIFFCSRQMSAFLTDDYPSPLSHEFVNVRELNASELNKAWKNFYGLKYISTCDYCDGLNYKSHDVYTAGQILPKKEYINMLKLLFALHDTDQKERHDDLLKDFKRLIETHKYELANLKETQDLMRVLNNYHEEGNAVSLNVYMLCVILAAKLYKDYRIMYVRGGYGDKNFIRVSSLNSPKSPSIENDTTEKIDLYISPNDQEVLNQIAELGNWKYYNHT